MGLGTFMWIWHGTTPARYCLASYQPITTTSFNSNQPVYYSQKGTPAQWFCGLDLDYSYNVVRGCSNLLVSELMKAKRPRTYPMRRTRRRRSILTSGSDRFYVIIISCLLLVVSALMRRRRALLWHCASLSIVLGSLNYCWHTTFPPPSALSPPNHHVLCHPPC